MFPWIAPRVWASKGAAARIAIASRYNIEVLLKLVEVLRVRSRVAVSIHRESGAARL
jgi:hypothetical protein